MGLGTVSHVSGTGWILRLGNDAQYLLWPSNVTPIADDGFAYAMDPATVTIWEISPRESQLDYVAADFLTFIEERIG